MLPAQSDPGIGEKGITEVGATLRMSLGARKFSALVEGFGRRTEYALVYCAGAERDDAVQLADDHERPVERRPVAAAASTIDAWIGPQLRAVRELRAVERDRRSSREISGYKSLRLVMEGIY